MKRFKTTLSPIELFLRISQESQNAYLLESLEGVKKLAQYSFIGLNPRLVITAKNGEVTIQDTESEEVTTTITQDPLKTVERTLSIESPQVFRFEGGAVGYIAYDAVRYWEKLPTTAKEDPRFPDILMGVYDDGLIFDHTSGETLYFYRDTDRTPTLAEMTKKPHEPQGLTFKPLKVNIPKQEYEALVESAKNYIASGDIFQVVLSKRYDFEFNGDLSRFYTALRRVNPSPYMYFLKMGEITVVGSSPETLVRVERGTVETYPIAGTRPREEDPEKNLALIRELVSDEKERAEHVMLVDLARNDIGKVSVFGSVQVSEFMSVHQYSHVQHLVSRVAGRLREDRTCYDALRAVFPAGTVSGAPKVRAMEIIEELEPTRRGPYAGAVGYFSYNGNMDFAITIRTLVARRNKCFIQVGGGIVADSIPEAEWMETEHKARALMKAAELSEVKE
ncbi:MAG: anthranilate synthase component I [Candidatus Freyarchaeota archaeon]